MTSYETGWRLDQTNKTWRGPNGVDRHFHDGTDVATGTIPYGRLSGTAFAPITLAYAQVTTGQTGITTEVDITGLTVTVVVPDGRRIRITGYVGAQRTVADGLNRLSLYGDGTLIQLTDMPVHGALEGSVAHFISDILTPTAGTHTYKLTYQRATGTGTVATSAGATFPVFILVEDITGSALSYGSTYVPVGQIAYAEMTADHTFTPAGADTAINGLSLNIVVPAGRVIRLRTFVTVLNNTNAQQNWIGIKEGSTVIKYALLSPPLNGNQFTLISEAILSPSAGSHTYFVTGNCSAGTLTVSSGSDRRSFIVAEDITPTPAQANSAPSSTLGSAQVITAQAGITTVADLTGLAVTVTVPAGRMIRISGYVYQFARTAGTVTYAELNIQEGATVLETKTVGINNNYGGADVVAILSPSAGTHTYKLTANTDGTVSMQASALRPAYILVEDITAVSILPTAIVPGEIVATSTTRPASPAVGTMIYESDTKRMYLWDGTSWVPIPFAAPSLHITRNANQSIVNATSVAISWDTVQLNNWAMWTAGNPTVITLPLAGVYSVTVGCTYAANGVGDRITDVLFGGTLLCSDIRQSSAVNGAITTMAFIRKFNANDTFTVRAYQSSGGALNIGEGGSGHERTFVGVSYLGTGN